MYRNPVIYLFVISLLITGGCATMNQSECQNADWTMIGLGDGSRGNLESYIDNHRRACAKFGVTPDLNSYRDGHAQGLRQYCTERNGFALGRNGNRYKGACPTDLEQVFLDGYSFGQSIYQANRKLVNINSSIKTKQAEVEKTVISKNETEQLLIHGKLTPTDRAILLSEIKDLDKAIAQLENEIYNLEGERIDAENDLTELNSLNIYQ